MGSVDAANPPTVAPSSHEGGIKFDDLKRIDVNSLSQSELLALSSCSNSAFDVRRTDDIVSPHLDRSIFNESAGSRRQTYSRLHHRSHSRFPGLHPSLKPNRHLSSDPMSHAIVHYLKHLFNGNHNPPPPPPPPMPPSPPQPQPPQVMGAQFTELGFPGLQDNYKIKRKRGRKRKNLNKTMTSETRVNVELQRINGKGEVVDFEELEKNGDELYSEELKRRTVGLETEEGVLGFLGGLEGQWCSRRKKRKYVDARMIRDVLPIGWKILLSLRRRDYRVSVYCRRYISPTGQQFLSCKEASAFLKSYFGGNGSDQLRNQTAHDIHGAYVAPSETVAHPNGKTNVVAGDVVDHSTSKISPLNAQENDDCVMGIENLPEVLVQDIFECFKCNLTFDKKNAYLQHISTYHQKTNKRCKIGTTIGEGVIIKDGKFECQFCHKVFEERRSYNGHVGVHVRNPGKNSDGQGTPPTVQENANNPMQAGSMSLKIIEIAQSSILETPDVGTSERSKTNHSASELKSEEAHAALDNCDATLNSCPAGMQSKDPIAERSLMEDLNCSGEAVTETTNMVNNEFEWNENISTDANFCKDSEDAKQNEILNYGNSNVEIGLGINDRSEDNPGLGAGDIAFQNGVSSVPLTESFQFFPSFDSSITKVDNDFSVVDQKLENVTGFEELRFDEIDSYKYGFVNGQELQSLAGGSMNLGSHIGLEDGFNPSVRFNSEEVMLNTLEGNQLTVCVWCRTEFKLEGIESEGPSDSIGYMCPTCKAKISGHMNAGL